jgi:hypothetical protein
VLAGEDASLALATLTLPRSKTELRSAGNDLSMLSDFVAPINPKR